MILDLTRKLIFTSCLAIGLYLLCNLSVYSLFAMSVIWPAILIIAYLSGRSLATPKDRISSSFETKKLVIFSVQNFGLFFCWYIDHQLLLAVLVNIAFRLNVLDMMWKCYNEKHYMYAFAGIPLLFWPIFDVQFHPQFIFEVTNVSTIFVILYMIWLVGSVLKIATNNAISILHPLLPLMFPNNLWFAARTFTGVNIISLIFFKPTHKYLADTSMHAERLKAFSVLYDSLFPLLFIGVMIQLLINQLV